MPTFMAIHNWKPDETIAIYKENLALIQIADNFPEGIQLCLSWMAGPTSAFCVWVAPSKDALEKLFKQYAPIALTRTEFVPIVQSYPPTMEIEVVLMQQLIDMASK